MFVINHIFLPKYFWLNFKLMTPWMVAFLREFSAIQASLAKLFLNHHFIQ